MPKWIKNVSLETERERETFRLWEERVGRRRKMWNAGGEQLDRKSRIVKLRVVYTGEGRKVLIFDALCLLLPLAMFSSGKASLGTHIKISCVAKGGATRE